MEIKEQLSLPNVFNNLTEITKQKVENIYDQVAEMQRRYRDQTKGKPGSSSVHYETGYHPRQHLS